MMLIIFIYHHNKNIFYIYFKHIIYMFILHIFECITNFIIIKKKDCTTRVVIVALDRQHIPCERSCAQFAKRINRS
jgi:hypothetical protein